LSPTLTGLVLGYDITTTDWSAGIGLSLILDKYSLAYFSLLMNVT